MKSLMVLNLIILYMNVGLSLFYMNTQWIGIIVGTIGISLLYFLNKVR